MAIALGLDVGGTKILACAIDDRGALAAETKVSSPRAPELLLEALTEAADAVLDLLNTEQRADVVGVGVGVPSLVAADGTLYSTPNLPALEGLPVRESFEARLTDMAERAGSRQRPWRLVLDNDATCAVGGELAFGAARGQSDVLLLTLGTGIGGGIVVGGKILRGARGFAGELGHCVVDPAGPKCHCGRTGCFELLASGSALARIAQEAAQAGGAARPLELAGGEVADIRGEHVLAAAREGDADALALFAKLATNLAAGIGNYVEVLDPGLVLIGGGLAEAGPILLEPTIAAFRGDSRRGQGPTAVPIALAELGPRAGAFGAAAEVLGLVE